MSNVTEPNIQFYDSVYLYSVYNKACQGSSNMAGQGGWKHIVRGHMCADVAYCAHAVS